MLTKLLGLKHQETEEHWISISDLMAGLMVIFLFIAISYMISANHKTDRIRKLGHQIENLLGAYKNLQEDLSKTLRDEFEGTPVKKMQFRNTWRGQLNAETLSIRFKKPFSQGYATVPTHLKTYYVIFSHDISQFFQNMSTEKVLLKSELKVTLQVNGLIELA